MKFYSQTFSITLLRKLSKILDHLHFYLLIYIDQTIFCQEYLCLSQLEILQKNIYLQNYFWIRKSQRPWCFNLIFLQTFLIHPLLLYSVFLDYYPLISHSMIVACRFPNRQSYLSHFHLIKYSFAWLLSLPPLIIASIKVEKMLLFLIYHLFLLKILLHLQFPSGNTITFNICSC